MDRLIVKKFGPLKDIDIDLNKINIFIGDNGSGKSVLAKLITIFTDALNWNEKKIIEKIKEFNIDFLCDETEIEFYVNIEKSHLKVEPEISIEKMSFIKIKNKKIVIHSMLTTLKEEYFNTHLKEALESFTTDKNIVEKIKIHSSKYIPAERNLISIFSKSLSSLIVSEIPLPKFLLQFSSDFEKAKNEIKELKFLNVKYVNSNQDKIYYEENEFVNLEHSSSGIQSALPLYLTTKYFSTLHSNIIIEEPEQNLFPKSQKEVVQFIIKTIGKENKVFMMTHSPYILTALNNLILANDVKNKSGLEAMENIVNESYCVDFDEVSAYSIIDGKSINIMDKEDRLIGVNVIDEISQEVSEVFDTLLSKLD